MEISADPRDIQIFIEVARQGSLSKAAKVLSLPNSHVSRRLKNLELALGHVLILRSTRHFALTDVGHRYAELCVDAMERLSLAQEYIGTLSDEPQGLIRLMCPFEFGFFLCDSFLPRFSEKYPKLWIDLTLKNKPDTVDYASQDLFIEVGSVLAPKSFIQSRFTTVQRQLYASPDFLKKHKIARIEDIDPAWLLRILPEKGQSPATDGIMVNSRTKEEREIEMKHSLRINSLSAIKRVATAGRGLCLVPEFVVARELKTRQLQAVLPSWTSRPIDLFGVTAALRRGERRVAILLQELTDECRLRSGV